MEVSAGASRLSLCESECVHGWPLKSKALCSTSSKLPNESVLLRTIILNILVCEHKLLKNRQAREKLSSTQNHYISLPLIPPACINSPAAERESERDDSRPWRRTERLCGIMVQSRFNLLPSSSWLLLLLLLLRRRLEPNQTPPPPPPQRSPAGRSAAMLKAGLLFAENGRATGRAGGVKRATGERSNLFARPVDRADEGHIILPISGLPLVSLICIALKNP
mgnify:CR=1 FL=1